MSKQVRMFNVSGGENTGGCIAGYAAVFNQVGYGEMIAPGAFTKTLQEQRDIKAYWSHNDRDSQVLARTENDTLRLKVDDTGLYCEFFPNPETTFGRNALALVGRGDVNQMSFTFRSIKTHYEEIKGESVVVQDEVQLIEVSLVSDPWYTGTSAWLLEGATSTEPEPTRAGHSTTTTAAECVRQIAARNRKLFLLENGTYGS